MASTDENTASQTTARHRRESRRPSGKYRSTTAKGTTVTPMEILNSHADHGAAAGTTACVAAHSANPPTNRPGAMKKKATIAHPTGFRGCRDTMIAPMPTKDA